ncbi:MAG: hypothetical protein HS108_14380 [Planctomycetes bacterium]|nr:hypothetical protein [Planctomycetota bacterium]
MKCSVSLVFFLFAGVLASCASIPEQELARYVQTFNQAENASKIVLSEAETDLQLLLARKLSRVDDPTTWPEFDPRKATGLAPDEQIKARDEVWNILRSYTQLLTSLAAGTDELSGELKNFVSTAADVAATAANAAYPGAGALIGLLTAPIEAIIRLMAAERFKEAVAAADKLVSDLVQLMIDDTRSFYHLKEVNVMRELQAEDGELLAQHKILLSRLRGASLPADSEKANALNADVEAIAKLLETIPLSPDAKKAEQVREILEALAATSNEPAMTDGALADISSARSWFEKYHKRCGAHRERLVAYINVLAAYVRALDTMRTAHAALTAAAGTRRLPNPSSVKGAFDVVHSAWKQYEALRK